MAIISKSKTKMNTVSNRDDKRLDPTPTPPVEQPPVGHDHVHAVATQPAPTPEPETGWKFRINGVYKKNMKPNTLFGIMHKVKRTQIGVVSGYITVFGLPDDEVRADGSVTNQWEYVTGGYEVPDATP